MGISEDMVTNRSIPTTSDHCQTSWRKEAIAKNWTQAAVLNTNVLTLSNSTHTNAPFMPPSGTITKLAQVIIAQTSWKGTWNTI